MEGVTLQPGAVSHDLSPETHQRLLACAFGKVLMPVDETTFGDSSLSTLPEVPAAPSVEQPVETEPEVSTEPVIPEVPVEPEVVAPVEAAPVVPPEFKCEEHDKTFKTQRYLDMHIKAAHKDVPEDEDEEETGDEE